MKTNLYALYSPYIRCYDLPLSSGMNDGDYMESYRRLIQQQPDQAFQVFLHEKQLCQIGVYDDLTGCIESFDKPIVICDLAAFFPAGYLSKKQDETNKYFQKVGLTDGKAVS